jgi:catechol 2,3-dioxygenase-like lactoylglutathione lyase family enzyme
MPTKPMKAPSETQDEPNVDGPRVRAQPLIAVRDVATSSAWYCKLLGCESGHGGNRYEMLVSRDERGEEELVLQLHAWGVDNHVNLTKPDAAPLGHGILLWFETTDFDATVAAARDLKAEIVEKPHTNPNSGRREIWVRDADGYVVVVASKDGN